jgi:hypothetical protein
MSAVANAKSSVTLGSWSNRTLTITYSAPCGRDVISNPRTPANPASTTLAESSSVAITLPIQASSRLRRIAWR